MKFNNIKKSEKTKKAKSSSKLKKGVFNSTRKVLSIFIAVALILNLVILSYGVYTMYISHKSLLDEREFREQELTRLEELTLVYSRSPDIFYNTAVAALNIAELKKGLFYIDKALILDPTFSEATELREEFFGD